MRIFSDGSKMPNEIYIKFILGISRALAYYNDSKESPVELAEYMLKSKYLSMSSMTHMTVDSLYEEYSKAKSQRIVYRTFMDELQRVTTEKIFGIDDELPVPKMIEDYIIKMTIDKKNEA